VDSLSPASARGRSFSTNHPARFSATDIQAEARRLLESSMAHNSVKAYNTGLNTFNKFRQQYQLSESWPPPLDHIIQFLAYMSLRGLSSKTARLYLSAISFRCKIANSQDTTKHFLVAKITEGFKRTSTLRRARYPITYDILQGILTKTSVVCRDSFEAQLFSTAFSLAFFGFFRVGELTVDKQGSHFTHKAIGIQDITFTEGNRAVSIFLRFSKTH
jgi:hypothetical protein